ncbi:MAG: acyl-CoA/acyl-ACP dehydrogenase [Polyangiaceae bacterium]|nr:acyl-CoA/acyl-ACP dehydrogenase [Polyangiaceae bacterium]
MPHTQPLFAELLESARHIAKNALLPNANAVDKSDRVPIAHLAQLAEAGLMGLAVPTEHGGHGAPLPVLRRYHGILAEACGTTAFVAIQHASACALIARSPHKSLQHRLLPRMAKGEIFGAPAFSHLRRPGPPSVTVRRENSHFVIDGVAPWVTGWGAISVIALGATDSNGDHVYIAVPIDEVAGIKAWPPMHLVAMNASSTVSITFSGARVHNDHLLFVQTSDEARASDAKSTLNQAPCSLGAARAAAKILDHLAENDAAITAAARAFHSEIDVAWADVETWAERLDDPAFVESALAVRAHCIELGVRAALAAVVASGGSSLKTDRDPQRIYREAALYSVAPQTPALKRATLARLSHRR